MEKIAAQKNSVRVLHAFFYNAGDEDSLPSPLPSPTFYSNLVDPSVLNVAPSHIKTVMGSSTVLESPFLVKQSLFQKATFSARSIDFGGVGER